MLDLMASHKMQLILYGIRSTKVQKDTAGGHVDKNPQNPMGNWQRLGKNCSVRHGLAKLV
jgi:hypothetical protein